MRCSYSNAILRAICRYACMSPNLCLYGEIMLSAIFSSFWLWLLDLNSHLGIPKCVQNKRTEDLNTRNIRCSVLSESSG